MSKLTSSKILETRQLIEQLRQARDEERQERDEEIYHLKWDIYHKKIREIEEERDKAIQAVEIARGKAIAEKDNEIQTHYSLIQQAQRILAILSTDESKSLSIEDDEVKRNDYGTVSMGESLGYLIDDDYLKVKLFIISNNKPKNKYSLIAIGRSIFNEPLIKYPYSYGMDIQDLYLRFRVKIILQDAPTPDELKVWLTKYKNILNQTLEQYEQVKQEYITTKQEYEANDFKELIKWWCPQCNNFQTIFESDPAFGATPQCYRHEPYVDMVKR